MMDLVAVDIGGTHARFSLASIGADGSITLGEAETLHTGDHASFQAAWEDFRARRGSLPPRTALSVAAPVGGESIRLTNNPWIIRPELMEATLGVERWTIVNDFAAVAHAVARAGEDQFHLAGPRRPLPAEGTFSVLGPGTGLGVAHLYRSAGTYRVTATEGGHIAFAPLDSIEDAIFARFRKSQTRVSVERIVSGPAIGPIRRVLASMEGKPVTKPDSGS